MTSQSPEAYLLSTIVHATAVALLLCVAYVLKQNVREPAKIIELVAGEGDNWAATEAPALGTPEGQESIKMPNIPVPMPKISEPEPAAPVVEPEPVKVAPVQKAAVETPTVKSSVLDSKRTTFTQDVARIAKKREDRLVRAQKAKQAAEEAKAKRLSKAEFDRLQKTKGGAQAGKIVRVDAKGIAGGVVGGSISNTKGGAGGKALTAEQSSQLERYFEYLKRAIKKSHIPPVGVSDLSTVVEFVVAADGSLSHARVVTSSGDAEFDQSVIEAIRRTASIGMRPDGRTNAVELEVNAREE